MIPKRAIIWTVARHPDLGLRRVVEAALVDHDEVVVAIDTDERQLGGPTLARRWSVVRALLFDLPGAWSMPLAPGGLNLVSRAAALPAWVGHGDLVLTDDDARLDAVRAAGLASDFFRTGGTLEDAFAPPAATPASTLVVTRAQPFHRGHRALVDHALALSADDVVVVVAAADRSHQQRDPFTAGERLALVRAGLRDVMHRVWLLAVPTPQWPALALPMLRGVAPRTSTIVTHNPLLSTMAVEAGHAVARLEAPIHVDQEVISATAIRAHLAQPLIDHQWLEPRLAPNTLRAFMADPALRRRLQALHAAEHR